MKELYEAMRSWEESNHQALAVAWVQQDGSNFCCISSANPTAVVITGRDGRGGAYAARVNDMGCLHIT